MCETVKSRKQLARGWQQTQYCSSEPYRSEVGHDARCEGGFSTKTARRHLKKPSGAHRGESKLAVVDEVSLRTQRRRKQHCAFGGANSFHRSWRSAAKSRPGQRSEKASQLVPLFGANAERRRLTFVDTVYCDHPGSGTGSTALFQGGQTRPRQRTLCRWLRGRSVTWRIRRAKATDFSSVERR